jgi:hypothetical protein
VDVVLSVGNSIKDINTFNADLKAALVAKGIPESRIRITSIQSVTSSTETQSASDIVNGWLARPIGVQTTAAVKNTDYSSRYIVNATQNRIESTLPGGVTQGRPAAVYFNPNGFNTRNATIEYTWGITDSASSFQHGEAGFIFRMNEARDRFYTYTLDNHSACGNLQSYGAEGDPAEAILKFTNGSSSPSTKIPSNEQKSGTKLYSTDTETQPAALKLGGFAKYDAGRKEYVKIELNGANVKVYRRINNNSGTDTAGLDKNDPYQLIFDWTDTSSPLLSGTYGFYVWDQKGAYFSDISLATESTRQFSEIIREPEWRATSKRFIVNLEDHAVEDFNDSQKLGEILARLGNEDIHYIGWGSTENKTQGEGFIQKNDNKGIFTLNTSAQSVQEMADYIYSVYNSSKTNNIIYMDKDRAQELTVAPVSEKYDTADKEWPNGKWKIMHEPAYFENNEGLAVFHNQYLYDMDVKFDKTGKYDVYYKDTLLKTVYAHKRPMAGFSASLDGSNNITITDRSYDLDHVSQANKGIAAVEYQWKESSAASWQTGVPASLENNKEYMIQQRVKDLEGEWSLPYNRYVSTSSSASLKPIAEFSIAGDVIFKNQGTLVVNDTSYSPAGSITQLEWKVERNGQTIYTDSTSPKTDYSSDPAGTYKIRLRVKNANGWSEYFSRVFTVIDDNAAPTVEISPEQGTFNDITNIHFAYSDEGGSQFAYQQYAITGNIEVPAADSPLWSGKSNMRNISVKLAELGTCYIHYRAEDRRGNKLAGYAGPYHLLAQNDYDLQSDKEALKIGYATGDHAGSVTKNVSLPLTGAKGSSVSWSSNTPALADALGNVYRPSAAQGDQSITLTATLKKGLSTVTKTFNLLIKALPITDIEAVALDKAALEIGYVKADYAEHVTEATITLPDTAKNGSRVTWSSSIPETIDRSGNVIRPEYSAGNQKVIMTATIEKNAVNDTRVFELIVIKKASASDTEAVAEDKENLAIGYEPGDNEHYVTRNIKLPATASNGSSVTWVSTEEIKNDGTVTRPEKGGGDAIVVLTATISRGNITDTRTFTLTVKEKLSNSHGDEIAKDKAELSIGYQGTDSAEQVTMDVVLADTASNGSIVQWISDNEAISVEGKEGKVKRPAFTEGDKQVILTAKLTNQGLTDTRIFKLLVKALPPTAQEGAAVTIGYQEGDRKDSVTGNVSLPTSLSNGSTVRWESSDAGIIATDGSVIRPADRDVEVTLKAYIDGAEVSQDFVLKVLQAGKDYSSEVAAAEAALAIGYGTGDNAASVTQNVILPVQQLATGDTVDVIWSTDSPSIIDKEGNVYRPGYKDGDKPVILTATIKKGLNSLQKIFQVTVKARTNDDTNAVALEADALELEIGYQTGDSANHVTKDIGLNTSLPNGSTVKWSSGEGSQGSISTTGTVTRPNAGSGDRFVTLTATITRGDIETIKKFDVVVKQQQVDYTTDVETAKASLDIIYHKQDTAASVTQNIILPLTAKNGATVAWSSNDSPTADQWGNIFRPQPGAQDKTVILTAVISKGGSTTTKSFTILVKALNEDHNDDKILTRDKESLDIGYAKDDSASSVTKDVKLSASVSEGTTVAWSSDKPESIHSDGKVTRPAEGSTDETVVLRATLTRGTVQEEKLFEVIVKAIPSVSDKDLLASDKASLKIGYATGDSASMVTQNVVLPAVASNGSTVSWSADKTNITGSGIVTRPGSGSADETVVLTAKLTKGAFSDQKTFTVIVKAIPADPNQVALNRDMESIAIGYAAGDSANSVTQNVTLITQAPQGSTVSWSADKTNITGSGIVTRPGSGSADETVVLTAKLTKGAFSNQKTFTVIVKAREERGGGSGSGSGSSSAPTKETIHIDVTGGKGAVVSNASVERTTERNGTKKDKVVYPEQNARETIQKLLENKQNIAKIIIPDPKDEVGEVEVVLPKATTAAFAENKMQLEITTANGRILIPGESFEGLNADLYFRVVPIKDQAKRSKVEKQVISDQLTLKIVEGRTISLVERPSTIETNMSSRPVRIALPLRAAKLPTDAAARESYLKNLFVYIEHSDGEKEIVKGSLVPYDDKGIYGLEFGIHKFSTFAIAYMASEVLSFSLPGMAGAADINYLNGTIHVTVDENTDISKLIAAFNLSEGATVTVNGVAQVSGKTVNDFSKPVTFVVKGADGTLKTWTITVAKASGSSTGTGNSQQPVKEGSHKAYIKGYVDGTMKPDNNITRAEMAAILHRILKDTLGDPKGKAWPDVKNSYWAKESIEAVTGWGLMVGLPDGSFGPAGLLTRAEMATIISRWTKLADRGTSVLTDIKGHWAQADIERAARAGYMVGCADSSFKPNKDITRAEVVTTINRVLKRGPLYGVAQPSWPDVPAGYWAFKDLEEASKDHSYTITTDGSEMKK